MTRLTARARPAPYGGGVSQWRRCEACRKVKANEEYDDAAATCRACLTAPPAPVRKRAAPVTTSVTAAAPARRGPVTGTVGSGDLEARERRAKRTAWEQLAQLHAEEYESLLQVARQAEGLRTSG